MSKATLCEKILESKVGHMVKAGDFILAPVDGAMASDTTAPHMIRAFEAMGGVKVWNPQKLSLVLDHAAPAPNEKIANLHQLVRRFAQDQGSYLYEGGEGICHHLMMEYSHVTPGDLFIGADSHTCIYGALGAFAAGVGSTDLAAILLTGHTWLKVPPSIRIHLQGALSFGVSAKDIVLTILNNIGPQKAVYKALEYGGSFFEHACLADKIPLTNMASEMGAKVAIVERPELKADEGAFYDLTLEIDVTRISPQVSLPGTPHQTVDVEKLEKTAIHMAFIGSCTNTKIEDLRQAAMILKGKKIAPQVRLLVVPASRQTLKASISDGTLEILVDAGAVILLSGCGPCVGTHLGIPGDNEVMISAANRNFKGRMGNPNSSVYLASPATVAASAITGFITCPKEVSC